MAMVFIVTRDPGHLREEMAYVFSHEATHNTVAFPRPDPSVSRNVTHAHASDHTFQRFRSCVRPPHVPEFRYLASEAEISGLRNIKKHPGKRVQRLAVEFVAEYCGRVRHSFIQSLP